MINRLIKKSITQLKRLQHSASQNESHCKVKAISSDPLAGFSVQIGGRALLTVVLGH
jgi:hypothetical protein